MSNLDFDFDIIWVCEQLGFPIQLNNKRSFNVDCPFCGRQKKLNVNIEKNTFRCPACDAHGGMLALYQQICGLESTKEARKELYRIYNGDISVNRDIIKKHKKTIEDLPPLCAATELKTRSATYVALLDNCSLSQRHQTALMKRGLSEEAIKKGQYRSVPQVGRISLARKLETMGYEWKGVPGFSRNEKGHVQITENQSGIFIPIRMRDGKISGMQIRFDNSKNGRRYIWFTSNNLNEGCSVTGIEQIHYVGFSEEIPKLIGITEGPLKADVAHHLLGIPFIAITGVSNTSQLESNLTELKALGVKEIHEFFDMDYFTKPTVKTAVDKAHDIICSVGFDKVLRRRWNENYKGIDDYALARQQGIPK